MDLILENSKRFLFDQSKFLNRPLGDSYKRYYSIFQNRLVSIFSKLYELNQIVTLWHSHDYPIVALILHDHFLVDPLTIHELLLIHLQCNEMSIPCSKKKIKKNLANE